MKNEPCYGLTPFDGLKIVRESDVVHKVYAPSEMGTPQTPTLIYGYDGSGHLVRVKRLVDKPENADPVYRTTTYVYENPNLPTYITRIVGPNGAVRNEFDEDGRLVATIDPEGARTQFIYTNFLPVFHSSESKGAQIIIDPLGNQTTHEYDAKGNIVATEDALHNIVLRTFDDHNNKLSETPPAPVGTSIPDNETTRFTYVYSGLGDMIQTMTVTHPHKAGEQDADHQTVIEYDSFGQVTSLKDPRSPATAIEYVATADSQHVNALGKVKTITDAQQKTTTFNYLDCDSDGVIDMQEIDPLGNKTETYLSDLGYTKGTATFHNTGTPGAPAWDMNPDTRTDYTYDENGNPKTQTTSRTVDGQIETLERTFLYDAADEQTGTTTKVNGMDVTGPEPEVTYDEAGRRKTEVRTRTLPDGTTEAQTTRYEYNQRGDLVQTTHPDGSVTASAFDAAGRLAASTDSAGRVTQYSCDPLGRLVSTRFADATESTTKYDAAGHILETRDRLGVGTWYAYDEAGRRTFITNSDLKVTEYRYDNAGNVTDVIDPLQRRTQYVFDERNRQIRTIFPDLTYTVTSYDDLGRRNEEINQEGVSTRFEYDSLGRLTAVTAPYKLYDMGGSDPQEIDPSPADQTITRYKYDEAGNLTEQLDANQSVLPEAQQKQTKFEYDGFGRRVKRTLPGGQHEEFSYDDIGNLKTHVDFNQKTTSFEYDAAGRLTKTIPDESFQMDPVVVTYLSDGRRASMKYPVGANAGSEEVTYEYQGDRLWKKVAPQGTITYQYKDNGNVASISTSHGTTVEYQYDSLNRLEEVHSASSVTDYTYDEVGNLKTVALPNAIATTYNYNDLNRLTDLSSALAGNTLASFDYNPDESGRTLGPIGNRRAVRETINCSPTTVIQRNVNFDYDKLYRLTKEDISLGAENSLSAAAGAVVYDAAPGYGDLTSGYGYDRTGNRHSRTLQSANSALLAQLSQFTGRNYDLNDRIDNDADPANANPNFDDNGNTWVGEVGPDAVSPSAGNKDEYDFENRLTKRSDGTTTISLVYDGDGNRVRKVVTANGTATATDYLVEDRNPTGYAQVLEELESVNGGASTLKRSFVYGLDLISQVTAAGPSTAYYGYDGNGNVRYLTDDSGQVTDAYDYDAFGVLLDEWHLGTPTPNDYLFAGERYDKDLGLYYLRARYMNPLTGSFWSMDSHEGSIFDPPSLHKYLYCQADPVNRIDPSGNETLLTTAISCTIAASLDAIYNGVVSGIGTALQMTIFGVEAGKGANDILEEFVLDQTGIQTAIDAAELAIDATRAFVGWITSHVSGQDAVELADAALMHEHFQIAVLPLLVSDSDYVSTDLDSQDPQCFEAGTLVLTESGPLAIEKVRVGDYVWAFDPGTLTNVLCPVGSTFIRYKPYTLRLEAAGEDIHVTPDHEFLVTDKGWTRAEALQEGDTFVSLDPESSPVLESAIGAAHGVLVYNIEVEGAHNYFVTDIGILVHNRSWLKAYHHFIPLGLGSKIPYRSVLLQTAGKLKAVEHIELHRELNTFLSRRRRLGITMRPCSLWRGEVVRRVFSGPERIRTLKRFYKQYKNGKYYPYFNEELKAMKINPDLFE